MLAARHHQQQLLLRHLARCMSTSSATNAAKTTAAPSKSKSPDAKKSAPAKSKHKRLPHVGLQAYNIQDPVWWQMDYPYPDSDNVKVYWYREVPKDESQHPTWDIKLTYGISAFFWFWIFYHLYWRPEAITGEWDFPWLSEWTDEELGIPPDDADDPEYWGDYLKKFYHVKPNW